MLTTNVQTTSDLMSIAWQAEHETVKRYTRLAEAMRRQGNLEVTALFDRMIEEERRHEELIEEWAELEGVQLRKDIGPIVWEDPQVSTDYDAEAVDPLHSTPYRALAFAVHNEERAFRFYIRIAASTEDETLREYAEILAQEELGHAALLRAMRRRAWHAEQDAHHEDPDIDPAVIQTLGDLLAVARCAEYCLAANLSAIGKTDPGLDKLGDTIRQTLVDIEAKLKNADPPGSAAASAVQAIEDYKTKIGAEDNAPDVQMKRLRTDMDRCFAFYDAVVAHAKDEAVMLAAQKLSESVLIQIGILHSVLKSEH